MVVSAEDETALTALDAMPIVVLPPTNRHPARDVGICTDYLAGQPVGHIAQHYGVSLVVVRQVARKAGCRRPAPDRRKRAREQVIMERVRAGETFTAIGLDVGVSRERIRQIAERNGIRACLLERPPRPATIARRQHKDAFRQQARDRKRQRQKARRRQIVERLRALAEELGRPPRLVEIAGRLGASYQAILRYFLSRRTRGEGHYQEATRRLYRAAGLKPYAPGSGRGRKQEGELGKVPAGNGSR